MQAIEYQGAHQVASVERGIPVAREGEVLVYPTHAGICGSDLNIYSGVHPRATAPLVLGHEFSGLLGEGHPTLEAGIPVTVNPLISCGTCTACQTGMTHVCEHLKLIGIDQDGGMQEAVAVPFETVVPLPNTMNLALGALVEPVAVAIHAIRQADYKAGDTAVVYGAGPIGLCVAIALKAYGASSVIMVEQNEHRLEKAMQLGFHAVDARSANTQQEIYKLLKGNRPDLVFDCAGHPSVLPHVLETVKIGGTVVMVAAYKKPAEVDLLMGMFKELTVKFTRVYTESDFARAIQLVDEQAAFAELITHTFTWAQAEEGFHLVTNPSNAIKVLFTHREMEETK